MKTRAAVAYEAGKPLELYWYEADHAFAAIAALPDVLIRQFNVPFYFGGTGLLIVVSVMLDFIQRIEANLMMRNYQGFLAGSGGGGHFANFIAAVRSGNREDLTCDIEVGHRSSALAHLGNISYRLDRELHFDGEEEQFVDDDEANAQLSREQYRDPYVVPNLA